MNIHLKFPFAVVGGVLVIPTWEEARLTKKMMAARSVAEAALLEDISAGESLSSEEMLEDADQGDTEDDVSDEDEIEALGTAGSAVHRKPTVELIARLIKRLEKTRRRETEADPPHLLEAVAVIVYDPDTATINPDLPRPGAGLRCYEFVSIMAETYDVRFD